MVQKPRCLENIKNARLVTGGKKPHAFCIDHIAYWRWLDTYVIAPTSSPGLPLLLSTLLKRCGKTDDAFGPPEAKITGPVYSYNNVWVHTSFPRFATARLSHTVAQISQCATRMGLVHSNDELSQNEHRYHHLPGWKCHRKKLFFILLFYVCSVCTLFSVLIYCYTQKMKHSQFSQMSTTLKNKCPSLSRRSI